MKRLLFVLLFGLVLTTRFAGPQVGPVRVAAAPRVPLRRGVQATTAAGHTYFSFKFFEFVKSGLELDRRRRAEALRLR